jgi:hypothetical protein
LYPGRKIGPTRLDSCPRTRQAGRLAYNRIASAIRICRVRTRFMLPDQTGSPRLRRRQRFGAPRQSGAATTRRAGTGTAVAVFVAECRVSSDSASKRGYRRATSCVKRKASKPSKPSKVHFEVWRHGGRIGAWNIRCHAASGNAVTSPDLGHVKPRTGFGVNVVKNCGQVTALQRRVGMGTLYKSTFLRNEAKLRKGSNWMDGRKYSV